MKCSRASRLLALYVEGDLQDSQCGPLDDHLRECGDCRNLAAELVESQALVKSLRSDAVPEAALSSVRRQVLPGIARIDNSHNWGLRVERALMSRLRPRYAMTAIAAILVVSGVFVSGIVWRTGSESIPVAEVIQPVPEAVPPSVDVDRRLPDPEPPETVVEAPVQSRPLVELASEDSEVAVATPTLLEPRELPVMDPPAIDSPNRGPTPPIVVKLVTDDPNVIIYWLIDSEQGDGV